MLNWSYLFLFISLRFTEPISIGLFCFIIGFHLLLLAEALTPKLGLAAPKDDITINPDLPADPKQWDVQNITQNGRSVTVVITDNGPIELMPEELAMYKKVSPNYGNEILKGPAIDYFKKHLTGTQLSLMNGKQRI